MKGSLKFKGSFQEKMEKEAKRLKHRLASKKQKDPDMEECDKALSMNVPAPKIIENPIQAGTGRIITSGNTVHGLETKFITELAQGDKLIIRHPETMQREEGFVSAVFSDKSLALREPFPFNLITFATFQYQHKPVYQEQEKTAAQIYHEKMQNHLTKHIAKPRSIVEYREKTGMWGYKTHKQETNQELTREQLLDIRAKKSGDKHCWI